MVGDDDVDHAFGERRDHGEAVILMAQRRRDLAEGAVLADIVLVEGQVVDRDAAGDAHAILLGAAHDLDRFGAGDHRGMIPGAGCAGEADVALQHHGLSFDRNARQALAAGEFAIVHHTGAAQVGVLDMVHDEGVEIARIDHGAAHDLRIAQALGAIAEGDRPGFEQQAELGDLLAFQPLGQGGAGEHVDDSLVAGAALDEIDDRGIVDHRIGVRAADHRGDAAGGGSLRAGAERLAEFGAGLTEEGAQVDKAGRQDLALGIDAAHALARGGRALPFDRGDGAVANEDGARALATRRGIDQACVDDCDVLRVSHVRSLYAQTFGRCWASASSTAMRTATPISTCSRISDWAPSATAEEISTPRFIGPGCITSASA